MMAHNSERPFTTLSSPARGDSSRHRQVHEENTAGTANRRAPPSARQRNGARPWCHFRNEAAALCSAINVLGFRNAHGQTSASFSVSTFAISREWGSAVTAPEHA